MARKIDWSKPKEFLFNHGEKIALGSCAAIAIILGLWGVLSARSAGRAEGGKTWPEAFRSLTQKIKSEMDSAQPPKIDESVFDRKIHVWGRYESPHVSSSYVAFNDVPSDKRNKPLVMPIRSEPGTIKLDYIAGLVYLHDKDFDGRGNKVVRGLEAAGGGAGLPEGPIPGQPKGKQPKGIDQPAGPALPFVQIGAPKRMVVVHAIFPMKKQMAEFRRALNLADQGDMLVKNPDDLPHVVGIDVVRIETDPDGKSRQVHLLGLDKDGKFAIQEDLEKLLRTAIFDERTPEALKNYLWEGLCTPMPKLGNRSYPKFELPGFEDLDWAGLDDPDKKDNMAGNFQPPPRGKEEGGAQILPGFKGPREKRPPENMPMEGGPAKPAAEYKIKDMFEATFKDTHPVLFPRLFGKRIDQDVNVYHVLGEFQKVPGKDGPAPIGGIQPPALPNQGGGRYFSAWDLDKPGIGEPGTGPIPSPEGGRKDPPKQPTGPMNPVGPSAPAHPDWKRDALVRFIDVDVKPGVTYSYAIRVRLANPNFGKEKDVAFAEVAASKVLPPSGWVETPKITIPQEYFLYAVDQQLVDDTLQDKADNKKPTPLKAGEIASQTTFQIHQWVDRRNDLVAAAEPYVIGDWVIAEKLAVKRGEPIGKSAVVQVPVWNKLRDTFEVPQVKHPQDKNKKGAPTGAHVSLTVGDKAPILIDFTGGKRLNKSSLLDEETAIDALVLMPDGKLKVFNSREASDASPYARERQDRVVENRRRVERLQSGGDNPPMMNPKDGPSLPIPKKGPGGGS